MLSLILVSLKASFPTQPPDLSFGSLEPGEHIRLDPDRITHRSLEPLILRSKLGNLAIALNAQGILEALARYCKSSVWSH
jgi:hypothetical protein